MHLTPLPLAVQITLAAIVLLLDLGVIVYCLTDLYQPDRRVNGFSKDIWALIIIVGNLLGCIIYFADGRTNP